ncbi:sigma-54 interaction domain-containing protein [Bacillus alveayuensis]|uniref:sigma-54 interaction domain-containing protein n=1 Tax=Aeribacillus alveayuensis TaxID=279215 RepID=UPI0005D1212D|nr:sigma 54-interacting transcriptional regulator [Bacillus alveayuensis]
MPKNLINDHQFQRTEWEKIFNSFYDGIWVADGDGRTILVNKAYEDLTGINRENVLGKYANDLLVAGILSQSAIPGVMKTLKPVTIINNINGKSLLVTGVPMFDKNNKLDLIVCNVRDITQLIELQKEIDKKNDLIQHYEMELKSFKDHSLGVKDGVVSRDEKMIQLFQLAKHVATTQSTILILGESGVGKEVLANWIHRMSPRKNKPFITVNCSAIPENLIESELFGYEKGAFTGATKRKTGLFEMADQGTIFLDEIGELPLNLQSKLLRVLQEKKVQRIGGGKLIPVDVRVISATNRSLEKMMADGLFREDLYYRLNVIPFKIPPLRERKDDIPILVDYFLKQFNKMYNRQIKISPVILDRIMNYHWPGNVRQLKNYIERLVVISQQANTTIRDLPNYLQIESDMNSLKLEKPLMPLRKAMDEYEKSIISSTLKKAKSIRQAAKILEVDHSTLVRKIQQYDIDYKILLNTNNE